MVKISLKSIQNNSINQVKPKTKQKPVNNIEPQIPKQSNKVVTKTSEDKPSLSDILTKLQKNMVENNKNLVINKQQPIFLQNDKQVEVKPLLENERNKVIGLLHLYISEFPDKLKTYKGKNFHKITDEELLNMKEIFKKEVNISNNLSTAVESSVKLLELYEYVCCDFMQVNIKGISKLGESQKYKDCIKAVLMKYFDNSLISCVELEYKLAYLVISNTLLCHQINSMETTNNKIKVITTKADQMKASEKLNIINKIPQNDESADTNNKMKEMILRDVNMKYSDF
jgi:hypothetical protein